MAKGKVPWFARRRLSCPDCGALVEEYKAKADPFICPRCQVSISRKEFWEANVDKWSTKADLSGENDEIAAGQ